MQTILGANGPIGEGLAREIYRTYTHDIRLVSRRPKKIHDTDEVVAADLMDTAATERAVEGSEIVYFTVGLPNDTQMWVDQFPTMMRNTIAACRKYGAKLVFFDNTYMYAGTSAKQTEESHFRPGGRKGAVRGEIATMLLDEMKAGTIEAAICRAPEFYGPGKTKSFTNALIFDRIRAGKTPFVPLSAKTKRTLIWTPDASRAMALIGNTPDAYGQTWHLPVDGNRLTYREIVELAGEIEGRKLRYIVLPKVVFSVGSRFVKDLAELKELLPRYESDNDFSSAKFDERFSNFAVTSYVDGIREVLNG